MKGNVVAVLLISLGGLILLFSWDKFVELFDVIGQLPDSRHETYFSIVGQGFCYFVLSAVSVLFGLSLFPLGIEGRKLKIIRAAFLTVLTIWFVLEIPIYKCDFYGITHSFWESKRGHFH